LKRTEEVEGVEVEVEEEAVAVEEEGVVDMEGEDMAGVGMEEEDMDIGYH
jgi:hypothetical protein